MAFQKPKKAPKFRDLIAILNQAKGVDNALYQTIQEIINRLEQLVAVGQEAVDSVAPLVASGGGGVTPPTPDPYSLDYLGDYVPATYNDGDIVVGPDGITYVCTKDGVLTPPEPWPPGTAPTLHHTTHEPGGGDAMEVDAVPTRGSLRTLGSGPNQAKPGNASATPSAHAPTHSPGGGDPLVNNAWLDTPNVFTKSQEIALGPYPYLVINDTSQPVDQRKYQMYQNAQSLIIQAVNDPLTIAASVPLSMNRTGDVTVGRNLAVGGNVLSGSPIVIRGSRTGDVAARLKLIDDISSAVNKRLWQVYSFGGNYYVVSLNDAESVVESVFRFTRAGELFSGGPYFEQSRSVAMGFWQDLPFSAANFFASTGGGTWTVGSAALIRNRYAIVGKTLFWQIYISWFSGSNTVAGTVTAMKIGAPAGISIAGASMNVPSLCTEANVIIEGAGAQVTISKQTGAAFAAGAFGLVSTMTWEIG